MASGDSEIERDLEQNLLKAQQLSEYLNSTLKKKKRKQRHSHTLQVTWRRRDEDGNIIAKTIKSPSSNSRAGRAKSTTPSVPDTSVEMPDEQEASLDAALKDLSSVLHMHSDQFALTSNVHKSAAATGWNMRNELSAEKWKEARKHIVDNMLRATYPKEQECQQQTCRKTAVVKCPDCMPMQHYCCDCDAERHQTLALHNRLSNINGYYLPLAPTVIIKDEGQGRFSHQSCVKMLPMELPDRICHCPEHKLVVIPGRPIVLINMKGRYDLALPALRCEGCSSNWTADLLHLQLSGYWPATVQFSTVFDTTVLQNFREMKLAAPGISRLAFLRMLDAQTKFHGRTGKVCSDTFGRSYMEWTICSFEVDLLCKEQPFTCPACSPQMLAASVDGNRKHYRFKKEGRSEDPGYFDGVLLCKDSDVAAFVEEVARRAKHVPGKGVCGRSQFSAAKQTSQKSSSGLDEQGLEVAVCRHGIILRALNMYRGEIFAYPMFLQKEVAAVSAPTFFCMDVICKYWPYVNRIGGVCPEYKDLTAMKPFLSVLHAKAHGIKCEIKWGGGNQDGAGSTLGEEVEMVNSFLSRTAINTKFMGKGARTDMLTVQVMDWNRRKIDNMCNTLCTRFHKTKQTLQKERQSLESLKGEMSADDATVQQWVRDVQDWAEHEPPEASNGSLLELRRKIEETSLGLRQRRARLYGQSDSNSGRSVLRSRIWREKNQLEMFVAQHDRMVEIHQQIGSASNTIQAGYILPWQLPPSDGVDFLSKKKFFDKVMHIRRLEEEVLILATEVRQHWDFLKNKEQTLSNLSICTDGSHSSLSEEGLQGFQAELSQRRSQLQSHLVTVKEKYLQLIRAGLDGTTMDLDEGEEQLEEQAVENDFESSSDEEDMDMLVTGVEEHS